MTTQELYLSTLELTHQMLRAAIALDWDALVQIERERLKVVGTIEHTRVPLSAGEKKAIAETIIKIERDNAEIVERVRCWQGHARTLLRMKA